MSRIPASYQNTKLPEFRPNQEFASDRSEMFSTEVCIDERIPQMAEESPLTAATERGPRRSVKCFFVDILATPQTFTIIAVIDAFHSFGDRLEPRQIASLQGNK